MSRVLISLGPCESNPTGALCGVDGPYLMRVIHPPGDTCTKTAIPICIEHAQWFRENDRRMQAWVCTGCNYHGRLAIWLPRPASMEDT